MSLADDSVKIEVFRLANESYSYREIEQKTGIPKSTIHSFLKKKTHQKWWAENSKPIAAGNKYDHRANMPLLKGHSYILTSAQNNTYVHKEFLESLEVMSDRLNARILVGTFSYNKSGFQGLEKGEAEWFDPKIKDYIYDAPAKLANDLIWCGELNILPTAVNPLSGFHSYTKLASGIIPHAKVQLESQSTHKDHPARMLYTTGAVTQRNYIEKKAGQKASFHHIFGALLVEVDDQGDWFVRQLIADSDSGSFYDLDTLYTPDGYTTGHNVEAINWGDLHSEKKDEKVYEVSFGNNGTSMMDYLKPKYQLVHDILDFESRNHHNIKDPYFRFDMYNKGKDKVVDNIKEVVDTLKLMHRDYSQMVIVESNHDLALKRWLKESDYKSDPANAIFFLEHQLEQYKSIQRQEYDFSIFEWSVKNLAPELKDVRFLKTDESFTICGPDGIECGQHSHLGSNGSRGSIAVYQKLGSRYNIGHSHSAAIKDGVYQAGVSGKLDMGYNTGASSWSHSHIITYPNGKRTIVTIKNGKFAKTR